MINVNNNLIITNNSNKTLKVDRHLPNIIIPYNKIDMFLDWWNEDIRKQSTIPQAFSEGYIHIDVIGDINNIDLSSQYYRTLIHAIAQNYKSTYRKTEEAFKLFFETTGKLVVYFKFLDSNKVYIEIYDVFEKLTSKGTFTVGEGECSPFKMLKNMTETHEPNVNPIDVINDDTNTLAMIMIIISMWYIATATSTTKYIYDSVAPTPIERNVVNVKKSKEITHKVYDFSKVRYVNAEKLVARRKGWTYSHSFEVHGHYRHYKNGKTIFVNAFTKGKGKEQQAQTITLNPTSIK